MENEVKRFLDLARRSRDKGITVYTDFLSQAQQSTLLSIPLDVKPALWGGFDGAVRCLAVFGEFDREKAPVRLMKVEPVSQKFAPELCHRDFLGAAVGLGIRRDMVGDIIVFENCGYLFCMDTVFEYIQENLTSVGRARVRCIAAAELPPGARPKMQRVHIIVSSKRLDSVLAGVYNLPRGRAKALFAEKRVFLNSLETNSPACLLKSGDTVSVRGFGKFIFEGEAGRTKKDNFVLEVSLYK